MPNTYPQFTDDEVKTILDMAHRVWYEIGADCLQAQADFGYARPRDVNGVTMSRAQVLELVIDANRLDSRLPPAIKEKFNALTYDQMKKLVRPAFPYSRYGL